MGKPSVGPEDGSFFINRDLACVKARQRLFSVICKLRSEWAPVQGVVCILEMRRCRQWADFPSGQLRYECLEPFPVLLDSQCCSLKPRVEMSTLLHFCFLRHPTPHTHCMWTRVHTHTDTQSAGCSSHHCNVFIISLL